MPLTPQDDLRHALPTSPYARESLYYDIVLPDEGLLIFFYTWVDGGNRAGYLLAVVGEGDEKLAFHAGDGVDVGARDFDDWAVEGLTVRHTELLERAELGFTADDVAFSARVEGLHPAFDYQSNADGCPSFVATNRFEQSLRITGTLRVAGREIAIDGTAHRDHSWGDRDWDSMQDWKWLSAQAGEDLVLNAMQIHGRGETTFHGYVQRDGVLAGVTMLRGETEYDEQWQQRRARFRLTDETGRVTAVELERFAMLSFTAGEGIQLNEAACRGTIDGRPAAIHLENGWDAQYAATQAKRMQAQAAGT
jgi:hypothetical protein